MNYIEELLTRQAGLLRAMTLAGGRRGGEERRKGDIPFRRELWELAEGGILPEGEALPETAKARAGRESGGMARPAARVGDGLDNGGTEEAASFRWSRESAAGEGAAWAVRELSERCERDARRYDGAFPLY